MSMRCGGVRAVVAAALGCVIVAGVLAGFGRVARPGSLPVPPSGSGPGGSYGGPGDTVPGGGPPSSGGANCDAIACPTIFSETGCDVVCDYQLMQDGGQNVFATCFPFSTVYQAVSYTFYYSDWQMLEALILGGLVVPDADGNVTICTPAVGNVQELYVLETFRINGRPTGGACVPGFPAIPAQVWVQDTLHGPALPSTCGMELLRQGTFGETASSWIRHCLQPPPDCHTATVFITFNVDCMRQAIMWWMTNYPAPVAGHIHAASPLFNVGFVTCHRPPGEH